MKRGTSPQTDAFDPYDKAKNALLGRLGNYCSYCERWIETNLAIEHIQPKGLAKYAHLETVWTNFLLACVNCNSTKGDTDVILADVLLPDRDNTFLTYDYMLDGRVAVRSGLPLAVQQGAQALLTLTGVDRRYATAQDENGKQIIIDRQSKRMDIFGQAKHAAAGVAAHPGNVLVLEMAVNLARSLGGFSIWMSVFANHPEMQRRLVDAFPGTRGSGCFDPVTQAPSSPHPNADGLASGSRI